MVSDGGLFKLRARRAQIATHIRDHQDLEAACKEFQVSVQTVLNACREHGVVYLRRRSGNPMGHACFAILWQLLYTEKKRVEIARELAVSLKEIHRVETVARDRNFPLPDRGGSN